MTLSPSSSNRKKLPEALSCETWPARSHERWKIRSRSARKTPSEVKYSPGRVRWPKAVRALMAGKFYHPRPRLVVHSARPHGPEHNADPDALSRAHAAPVHQLPLEGLVRLLRRLQLRHEPRARVLRVP